MSGVTPLPGLGEALDGREELGGLLVRLLRVARRERAGDAVLDVLFEHFQHCVAGALASGDPDVAGEKSRELLGAVQRFAKTM